MPLEDRSIDSPICDLCVQSWGSAKHPMNAYCQLFEGDSDLVKRCIVWRDGIFRLMPALGALCPGHCLLVPEFHFASYSELLCFAPDKTIRAINAASTLLREAFGKQVSVFEHGPFIVTPPLLRDSRDHAHLHLIPIEVDLSSFVMQEFAEFAHATYGNLRELGNIHGHASYLLFQHLSVWKPSNSLVAMFPDDELVPKQFLRRVIGKHLGITENWKWEDDWRKDNIIATIESIEAIL